ncbi:hypothetical protein C1I89_05385 [Achromobacter pulmonis]|uniref:Uncharacterized protein n=1 Tax=Achromobacter pulmonis TaxID=1389932 RepID=A0A2N8KQT2_9BURK|nr:hypothetical protein [Achromobacter pulmonis]PND35780.1 hypothetical protein C1I89_05385 [Achromobacter pulmonis]
MNHYRDSSDIERWLNEGGLQLPKSAEVLDPAVLDEGERRVIACLGAASLSIWHEFPTDIRRMVLQSAVSNATYDATLLKEKVAAFMRGRQGPLA